MKMLLVLSGWTSDSQLGIKITNEANKLIAT